MAPSISVPSGIPVIYAQAAGAAVKLVAAQVYAGRTAGNAFLPSQSLSS